MFEFFFKYPAATFSRGEFVFLGRWPVWMLAGAIALAAALLLLHVRRNRGVLTGMRPVVIWGLQTCLVVLLLFALWQPALSVATLRPQQNIVAVVVDNSRSMQIQEDGATRLAQASSTLRGGLMDELAKKFQVRLYRFGANAARTPKPEELNANLPSTRIGDSVRQVIAESSTLPLGAIVLLSDGADNTGGIDLETISEIRRQKIPVHTIGFGRERFERDIEVSDVVIPQRALKDSRLNAQVTLQHSGYNGQRARVAVKEAAKVLASQEVTLKGDGQQSVSVTFTAGAPGPRHVQVAVEPLGGEQNIANNSVSRLVQVETRKPRILYLEGEPRWEFKFIRRAVEEDPTLELVTILRTTQNKIYRQGTRDAKELEAGFPAKAEELFAYDGLLIGSVEVGYFTPAQQELIREFANRRGGGVLFLGGRAALSDGGYPNSPLAEMFPVELPNRKGAFQREQARIELTPAGRDSIITRLEDRPEANAERWKKMPPLADYQEVGGLKPGAVALLQFEGGRVRAPLLSVQNYGRGRVAVLATSGTWRWQMLQDLADKTHERFWQQLLRHLVAATPGRVNVTTPKPVLSDDTRVPLRAEVRDRDYQPLPNARVEARIVGPEGLADTVELAPAANEVGVYTVEWQAEKPGGYLAETVVIQDGQEVGRDAAMFRREDGVAENFGAAQNRELLEKLAEQTGGRYYRAGDAKKLLGEITYSEAGITTRETRDLWNMPIIFLGVVLIRGTEWLLRRRWGVV
jgi:uncharacterized membrane protein